MTETEPREGGDDRNPEREGPPPEPGTGDPPEPDQEQGPSGPPHESIPGDSGKAPNPKR
jgi:hypothetical protein